MKIKPFTSELLEILGNETGCSTQFNNCPCRTCFFSLTDRLKLTDERAQHFWDIVSDRLQCHLN